MDRLKLDKSIFISAMFWVSTILLSMFIFSSSSQTGTETAGITLPVAEWLSKIFFTNPTAIQVENLHYFIRQFARISLYMAFGFLSANSVYLTFKRFKFAVKFITVSCVCSIIAFFDEWRKQFIPGRHFELGEAFVNIVCVWVGALLAMACLKLIRRILIMRRL